MTPRQVHFPCQVVPAIIIMTHVTLYLGLLLLVHNRTRGRSSADLRSMIASVNRQIKVNTCAYVQ